MWWCWNLHITSNVPKFELGWFWIGMQLADPNDDLDIYSKLTHRNNFLNFSIFTYQYFY